MNKIPDISISDSECVILFPFQHRFLVLKQSEKVENWKNWFIRLNSNEKKDVYDSLLQFQPYIRELLFPEMNPPMIPQNTRHLTFMLGNEPFSSDFALQIYKKNGEPRWDTFEGHISFIDAYLFDNKEGLLVISMNPKSNSLHQLVAFLQTLKVFTPSQDGLSLPYLNLSVFPNSKKIASMKDFIGFLLENIVDTESFEGSNGKKYIDTSIGKEESERCHTFVYTKIWDNQNIRNDKADSSDLKIKDLWLFKIGMMTYDENEKTLIDEYIKKMVEEHRIGLWELCQGIVSNNNVAFLEFANNADSNGTSLQDSIKREYFFLYIYCICQKIGLLRLQDNFSGACQPDDGYEEYKINLEKLLIQMTEFQDHFWFTNVTKDIVGEEIYRKYQCGLGTKMLYECVNEKIDNLHKFYLTLTNKIQLNHSYKLNRTIWIISAILGIPILFVGFLNMNIRDYTSKEGLSLGSAILLLFSFIVLGMGVAFLINWRNSKKIRQDIKQNKL